LPDEFFDAETEQMGNTSYGIDIPTTNTRAGRISRPPPRLIETVTMAQAMNDKAADYKCELTPAEERYYDAMRELNEMALIGAGIGGGFVNSEELHVMN
jgi:predicted NBD/HSP70 family sugar kinase